MGESWSEPIRTDIPSAVSKSHLIKGADGTIYLLLNPSQNRKRDPLSLFISRNDMKSFDERITLVSGEDGNGCMCYPDGFIDNERGVLCFAFENRKEIFYAEYPI